MIKKYIIKLSKLLNINPPKIIYNNEIGFSYRNNIIYIRNNIEFNKQLFLAIHEFRHYYQDLYIRNNKDEISNIWKYEMDNYNMKNYLDYNIELDAYAFSYLVMNYYFHIFYKLPDIIEEKVINYVEKYKYLYLFIFKYKV